MCSGFNLTHNTLFYPLVPELMKNYLNLYPGIDDYFLPCFLQSIKISNNLISFFKGYY